MRADAEDQVIQLLDRAGFWNDPDAWRDVGDDDGNYATIGNQQSEAIAALIEKIVNSVDSRLTNACLEAGISPTSEAAPQSIREAVAVFFEHHAGPLAETHGRVAYWDNERATAEGRLLTVAVTGYRPPAPGWPSITVADAGEGQTPDAFPTTFMSLHRTNKLRIPFVQGKFNMGGTGALQFCEGRHRLQLVVSRRNPRVLSPGATNRDFQWGFTVVRREPPSGRIRSSVFTYLAPVQVKSGEPNDVLGFDAETWPIFPEADSTIRDAYHRHSTHGALIKLYEYHWRGTRTNVVLGGDGLLRRLDQGLPEIALPVRIFECRPYSGHAASFATNVLGLSARLERDKADKLEEEPIPSVIDVDGKRVTVKVFAFKKGQASEYRTSRNGVLFAVNGQTHASESTEFFRRQSVGMSYLADSLLAIVDCTSIDGEQREDLFMNSRDRLRDNVLSGRLKEELEDFLGKNEVLRSLRNRRREQDISEKLADSKPLTDVLQDILRRSPSLAKLFLQGMKLPSPFSLNTSGIEGGEKGTGGAFVGRHTPTYFHFKGKRPGDSLERQAHIGSRVRVQFETDAQDDYFIRDSMPGQFNVWRGNAQNSTALSGCRMDGPRAGVASLHIDLPPDTVAGQTLSIEVHVTDEVQLEPFVNHLALEIRPEKDAVSGGSGKRPPASTVGAGIHGGGAVGLPNIKRVTKERWESYDFHRFTEESALVVVNAGVETPNGERSGSARVFDFYVNVDNKYLKTVLKESKQDLRLLEARFTYSLVLIGLALLNDDRLRQQARDTVEEDDEPDESIEKLVARTSSAVAPILLPMIEAMSGLSLDDD